MDSRETSDCCSGHGGYGIISLNMSYVLEEGPIISIVGFGRRNDGVTLTGMNSGFPSSARANFVWYSMLLVFPYAFNFLNSRLINLVIISSHTPNDRESSARILARQPGWHANCKQPVICSHGVVAATLPL